MQTTQHTAKNFAQTLQHAYNKALLKQQNTQANFALHNAAKFVAKHNVIAVIANNKNTHFVQCLLQALQAVNKKHKNVAYCVLSKTKNFVTILLNTATTMRYATRMQTINILLNVLQQHNVLQITATANSFTFNLQQHLQQQAITAIQQVFAMLNVNVTVTSNAQQITVNAKRVLLA